MARAASTDPLMSHHFALLDVPVAGLLPTAFPIKTVQNAVSNGSFVGFRSLSMPEVVIDTKEIKEGNWPYKHKTLLGFVDSGQVTMEFAVFNYNTDMWLYFQQAIYGRIAPRRSFIIVQTRADKLTIQRAYWLEDCIPTTWKPVSDFDASGSEVTIESLTLDVHRIRLLPVPVPLGPNASVGVPF